MWQWSKEAVYFLGRFEHTIDAKGRLTIPSNYRGMLPGGIFITSWVDGNLKAFPYDVYEKAAAEITAKSVIDFESRAFSNYFFENTVQLDFDSAGRILIPANLKKTAGIETSVVISGAGKTFDIWSPERWAQNTSTFSDPATLAKRWNNLDIRF